MNLIDKDRLKSRFRDECGRLKCNRWDISAILDEIDNAPVVAPLPNPPLTLEEIRGMDGEPVYLSPGDCWVLISNNGFVPIFTWEDGSSCSACDWYTQIGLAYRRKPEEGTT